MIGGQLEMRTFFLRVQVDGPLADDVIRDIVWRLLNAVMENVVHVMISSNKFRLDTIAKTQSTLPFTLLKITNLK